MRELAEAWAGPNARARPLETRVAAWLTKAAGSVALNQLTSLAVNGVLAEWKEHYAKTTVRNMRCALARLLKVAEAAGCPHEVRDNLARVRKPGPKKATLTPPERDRLIAAAPPYLRLFILLLSDCAMRFTDAASVRPRDWNPQNHTITWTIKKTDTQLQLPASPAIEQLFALAPDPDDRDTPFIWKLKGTRLTSHTLRDHLATLVKKLGMPPAITPHDFRRLAVNSLYDLTKNLPACQQLLGHASLATTALYLQARDPANLRPLLDQLLSWNPAQGEKTQ